MSAMADYFIHIAEEAGMDPDDDGTFDAIAAAYATAPQTGHPDDLFDHLMAELIGC